MVIKAFGCLARTGGLSLPGIIVRDRCSHEFMSSSRINLTCLRSRFEFLFLSGWITLNMVCFALLFRLSSEASVTVRSLLAAPSSYIFRIIKSNHVFKNQQNVPHPSCNLHRHLWLFVFGQDPKSASSANQVTRLGIYGCIILSALAEPGRNKSGENCNMILQVADRARSFLFLVLPFLVHLDHSYIRTSRYKESARGTGLTWCQ